MDGDVLSGSAREGGRLESDCGDCCGSEYGARIANSKSAHVFQMRRRMDRREGEREKERGGGTDGRRTRGTGRKRESEGTRPPPAAVAEHAAYQRIIFGGHLVWVEAFIAINH